MEHDQVRQFIQQLGAEAGDYLRNHFYTFKNVVRRDVGSLATNVELDLESILQKRIAREYPNHRVVFVGHTEPEVTLADWVWIIDALDGSQHFSRGNPLYSCNIAVQYRSKTMFGVVNQPQVHQLFFAEASQGAYLNGIQTRVSDQGELAKAYVYVELPEILTVPMASAIEFSRAVAAVDRLVHQAAQVETFRIGAYGQCLVAAGCFEAYVDLSGTSRALAQAASLLIVKEAGGEVLDLHHPTAGAIQVVASNGKVTPELRQVLGI